jgi:hypothetical protein
VFFGDNGSSDRALGYLPTSNQSGGFGLVLINASADIYTAIDISYVGEQWRAGEANILNVLTFSYGMGTTLTDATNSFSSLNFAAVNLAGGEIGINGNDPANQS